MKRQAITETEEVWVKATLRKDRWEHGPNPEPIVIERLLLHDKDGEEQWNWYIKADKVHWEYPGQDTWFWGV